MDNRENLKLRKVRWLLVIIKVVKCYIYSHFSSCEANMHEERADLALRTSQKTVKIIDTCVLQTLNIRLSPAVHGVLTASRVGDPLL